MRMPDSNDVLSVVISGTDFQKGVTVRLGITPIVVIDSSSTTIDGIIPKSMNAGTYNLIVTNPDGKSGRLENAFTVFEPGSSHTITPALATYGSDAQSDSIENVQIIFLDMPDSVVYPVYIHIADPQVDSEAGPTNIEEDVINSGEVITTTFTVYGGDLAYTDPQARAAPPVGLSTGSPITTTTFESTFVDDSDGANDNWFTFGPLMPDSQAEHVGNRYVFRLNVEGQSGDDGNIYKVAFSRNADVRVNDAVPGGRIFAFSWYFKLGNPPGSRPKAYPYVGDVDMFTQHNCNLRDGGTIQIITPEQTFYENAVSTVTQVCQDSTYLPVDEEKEANWAVSFEKINVSGTDTFVFWVKDNDTALALFLRAGLNLPP